MKSKQALLFLLLVLLGAVVYLRMDKYKRMIAGESAAWHGAQTNAGTPIVGATVIDRFESTAKLSLESRLFRTTMLGRTYGLTAEDFTANRIPRDVSYLATQLFSAATTALRYPNCCYPDSAANLRKLLLNSVEPTFVVTPSDLPPMKSDDLMLIHVYAMVSAGQDQLLMNILNEALKSKERFVRIFAVNALRAYGGGDAMQLMSSLRRDEEVGAIANVALALDWSNFNLPRAFAGELPFAERTRKNILARAADDTLQTGTILPTMMMGFLAEDAPAPQLQAELNYLRDLNFKPNGFLMYRHGYAVTALAFRKGADFDYWKRAYLANNLPVARIPIIRAMVLLDPLKFMAFAPEMINAGSANWDAYEFKLAYALLAQGTQPYSYYDLFFTPPNQYRLRYPFQKDAFAKISPKPILERWAAGVWLRDAKCPSCDMSWLTMAVPDELEPLLFQGFIAAPKRDISSYWQLVTAAKDPRAQPVLKFLLEQEKDESIRTQSDSLLRQLATAQPERSCCEQTQACLESQVINARRESNTDPGVTSSAALTSVPELTAYLRQWRADNEQKAAPENAQNVSVGDPTTPRSNQIIIQLVEPERQMAWVQTGQNKAKWTYWLGCWRRE
jgi:hypothetical protein